MRRVIVAVALAAGLSACGGHSSLGAGASTEVTASDLPSGSLSPTDVLVNTGVSQLKAGDATSASTTFRNVLSLDPKNVYALYNLGLIAQQAHDPTTASRYYEAALAGNGDYTPALYNEAIVLEKTDLTRSIGLYRHTLRVDPTFAAAYIRLGFAPKHEGETSAAAQARAKGLALDPRLASATAPAY